MTIEEEPGRKILGLYERTIFGKVSKAEIDLVVFGAVVRKYLSEYKELPDTENLFWFRLDARHIHSLSMRLRTPESRVSSLSEQCALMEIQQAPNKELVLKGLQVLMSRQRLQMAYKGILVFAALRL
jgi:hypothetical protein